MMYPTGKYESRCECGFVFQNVTADAAQAAMELHNRDLAISERMHHYHQKVRAMYSENPQDADTTLVGW